MFKSLIFCSVLLFTLNLHAQEITRSDDDMIDVGSKVNPAVLLIEENAKNPEDPEVILMSEKKVKELSGWTPIPTVGVRGQIMFLYFSIGAQAGIRTLNGMLEGGIYISRFMYGASTIYNYGNIKGVYAQIGLLKDKNGDNARIYLKGRAYNLALTNSVDSSDKNADRSTFNYTGVGIGGSLGFSLCGKNEPDAYWEIAKHKFCPGAIEVNWDHSTAVWKDGYKTVNDLPSFTLLIKI